MPTVVVNFHYLHVIRSFDCFIDWFHDEVFDGRIMYLLLSVCLLFLLSFLRFCWLCFALFIHFYLSLFVICLVLSILDLLSFVDCRVQSCLSSIIQSLSFWIRCRLVPLESIMIVFALGLPSMVCPLLHSRPHTSSCVRVYVCVCMYLFALIQGSSWELFWIVVLFLWVLAALGASIVIEDVVDVIGESIGWILGENASATMLLHTHAPHTLYTLSL